MHLKAGVLQRTVHFLCQSVSSLDFCLSVAHHVAIPSYKAELLAVTFLPHHRGGSHLRDSDAFTLTSISKCSGLDLSPE